MSSLLQSDTRTTDLEPVRNNSLLHMFMVQHNVLNASLVLVLLVVLGETNILEVVQIHWSNVLPAG